MIRALTTKATLYINIDTENVILFFFVFLKKHGEHAKQVVYPCIATATNLLNKQYKENPLG